MDTHADEPRADDGGIGRKLAFLKNPASYPTQTAPIRSVETHMSWVFLTDGLAFKLKKPVRSPYLDFGTPEARRRNCEEELRLNRRLAPGIYLAVVPLTDEGEGRLALGGDGAPVDWLVKMRRLPEDELLDRRIARGKVSVAAIDALAALLTRFYGDATRERWPPGTYGRHLRREAEESGSELQGPEYALPAERVRAVQAMQLAFLARAANLVERRMREGHVVEGHGDLRPEHVCLLPAPVIIDCLEFNRDLRLLDPVDELAFLALECERLGDAQIGERILERYRALSGDRPDPHLVAFYKSLRACVRGKVALWHLHDPAAGQREKWLARGRQYLALAQRHADALG